jgi:hypothetical protein
MYVLKGYFFSFNFMLLDIKSWRYDIHFWTFDFQLDDTSYAVRIQETINNGWLVVNNRKVHLVFCFYKKDKQ